MEIKLDIDTNQIVEDLMAYLESEIKEQAKSQIIEAVKFQMKDIDFQTIVNERFNAVVNEIFERRAEGIAKKAEAINKAKKANERNHKRHVLGMEQMALIAGNASDERLYRVLVKNGYIDIESVKKLDIIQAQKLRGMGGKTLASFIEYKERIRNME